MAQRFVLHPIICPSGMWAVTGTLAGVERQSFSPADEHCAQGAPCQPCSHSTALQPGRHSCQRGWQLHQLTSSSPAKLHSVSLLVLPFKFLVGCLSVLAYWEPESTNPVVCTPIGTNTWLCVSCPVFNFFKFSRGSGTNATCYTVS